MTTTPTPVYLLFDPASPPADDYIVTVTGGRAILDIYPISRDDLNTALTVTIPAILESISDLLADKVDKDVDAVATNFAYYETGGNLVDSGYQDNDFVRKVDFNAKGDMMVATAADTPEVLTVGGADTILMADSGESAGVKWAALAASQIPDLSATYEKHNPVAGPVRWFSDFLYLGASSNDPWAGAAIASGAIGVGVPDANHPGVCKIASATGNNSGYTFTTHANLVLGGSEKLSMVFYTYDAAAGNNMWNWGWGNAAGITDPTTGAWLAFDQSAGTITGKAQNNSGGVVSTSTSFTYAASTWYRATIEINSAFDTITFTIYNCATGAVAWTNTVTTMPTTGYLAQYISGWNTAPVSARSIVGVDYMAYEINRTLTR